MKSANTTIVVLLLGTVHSLLLRSKTSSTRTSLAFSLDSSPQNHSHSRWQSRLFQTNNGGDRGSTSKNNGDVQATVQGEQKWQLMEDWILQDKVPDFTVRGSSTTTTSATFWRQLKHTIPELSARTETELQDRYKELAADAGAPKRPPEIESTTTTTPFVPCGESPEVLTNWWMDLVETKSGSSAVMMMNGRLSNGSNIWFPLQSAGTVGADKNLNDSEDKVGFSWLLEEGNFIKYVESSAGCIYELGSPKPNSMATLLDNSSSTSSNQKENESTNFFSTNSVGTTVSAVVASSLLSAFLAFSAGQASIPPTPVVAPAVVQKTSAIVPSQSSQAVTPAVLGSGMRYERSLQKDGTVKVVELSIGEQRASQELKVYRDERRLTNLQDRLEADQITLQELTQKEIELGPSAAAEPLVQGVPRSPKELSISEQRARAELKVGGDKRRIVKMKENLSKDKQTLKELQTQEKQQQQSQRFFLGGRPN